MRMSPEQIAESAAAEVSKDEVENVALAYAAAALTVERLREAGWVGPEAWVPGVASPGARIDGPGCGSAG